LSLGSKGAVVPMMMMMITHGKDVTKNIKIFTYTFIKKLKIRDLFEGMRNNNRK